MLKNIENHIESSESSVIYGTVINRYANILYRDIKTSS